MRSRAWIVLAAVLLTGITTSAGAKEARYQIAPAGDAEIHKAEIQARETLPTFWKRIKSGDRQIDLALIKLGFETPRGGTEYLWAAVGPQSETDHRAMLVNDAVDAENLHAKQVVRFNPDQIGDWSYRKGGKFYGQFTTRVMIKRAKPDIAREEAARLWPTPLEPMAR